SSRLLRFLFDRYMLEYGIDMKKSVAMCLQHSKISNTFHGHTDKKISRICAQAPQIFSRNKRLRSLQHDQDVVELALSSHEPIEIEPHYTSYTKFLKKINMVVL
ncbi:13631_t:CDS:2, partial [Cetraspora pellucida]